MLDQLDNLATAPYYLIAFVALMTGILGSTHCVGMCGGLVLALGRGAKITLSYQIGRLLGYTTLGIALPLLGLNTMGLRNNVPLAYFSAIMMGSIFIFIGLKNLFSWKKSFFKHDFLEKLNVKIWGALLKKFRNFDIIRSLLAGSASALLPCGLLWTVLILTFTASSPLQSFVFVFFFWLGTIPALSFAPEIVNKLAKPLLKKLPRVIPIMLIIVGVSTISFRILMLYQQHACH